MPEWKSVTVPLLHPIKVGEFSLNEITFTEPDLDAMEIIEEAGFETDKRPTVKQVRAVIAALSKQPDSILGKIHRDDFVKLTEAVVPLVSGSSDSESTSDSATETTKPDTTTSPGTSPTS